MSEAMDGRADGDDDGAESRRLAVAALGASVAVDRSERLFEGLGDVDWRVRKEAARVASEVAAQWELVPQLVSGLCQGDNVGLRNAALEALERLGPRSAEALLGALPNVPDGARKFLVAALGFAGGAGVEKLAELSTDRDPNTAQAALEALARTGGKRAEEALRGHLASRDPVQRLAALEGLERLEARVGLDELRPLLRDRLVHRSALRLLGFSEEPEALDLVLRALEESGPSALHATIALGRVMSRGGAVGRSVEARAQSLSERARASLRELAASSAEPHRAAISVLLLARDVAVLGLAAELGAEDRLLPTSLDALRAWGAAAVVPLLEVASTLSPRARGVALEMASDLATTDDAPDATVARLRASLRGALDGEEVTAAVTAAQAFERWAEPGDAGRLVSVARRFPERAALPAGRALERLAAQAPKEVAAALAGLALDGAFGAALLPAVAALGGESATDLLQATLNADDPRARRAAVLALPKLGGRRAAELAGFALADEDVDVQVAAVMVLGALRDASGAPLGVEPLRLALRATAEPVVAAAARALGAIDDRGSIPSLRELLSEGQPGVAVAAMESLRALEVPGLDDLLVEALGQSDEELVKEALRAIAESSTSRRATRMALALEHPAWDVRQLAATLLGASGDREAGSVLSDRLAREADPGVRAALEAALAMTAIPAGDQVD